MPWLDFGDYCMCVGRGQSSRKVLFLYCISQSKGCFVVFISCSLSTSLKMWFWPSGSGAGWKWILRLTSDLIGLSNVSSMGLTVVSEETFLRDSSRWISEGKKRARFAAAACEPRLNIDQWRDALFLRSRDVQGGFIPSAIQTSSYMLHMVAVSLSLPPSSNSLSLSLSSQPICAQWRCAKGWI